MQKLIRGLHQFQSSVFRSYQDLFDKLANGQAPEVLFITCADSRINPFLITQTDPGDLFLVRNAGNIVPPYGAVLGGEAASIEYAVSVLGVRDIIICGHSFCGAVTALLNAGSTDELPAVDGWLKHAAATRHIVRENYTHLEGSALLTAAIQENVLVQLENLRTHPTVASGVVKGQLHLHGWMYKLETGQVFAYNPEMGQYTPATEARPLAPTRLPLTPTI